MDRIRNFSIIAHIDAGKSTLADRMLELTHTVSEREMQEQLLDSNPIERERGITIKMAPVAMHYSSNGVDYQLNLIDTPGHVDFNYEVERALAACEGAILLIDATKGVQAQTVANYHLAQNLGLTIIPAINKIDANLADIAAATRQVQQLLNTKESPLLISAKTGAGVKELLAAVIEKIPSPRETTAHHLQALIFNSFFHPHLGVIAFVRLFSGAIKAKDQLRSISTKETFTPTEIGILSPDRIAKADLTAGSVGYLVTGQKDIRRVLVGDTITLTHDQAAPALAGFRHIKPNVYFDVFPIDNAAYQDLLDALAKLKLNDASLETKPIKSLVLGQGVRVGFLGLLHAEVVSERLEREFNLPVISTSPSVEYRAVSRGGDEITFNTPNEFPDPAFIHATKEPVARVEIVVAPNYLGAVLDVCQELRGSLINMVYLDQLVELSYTIPMIEVITSLHDRLKSASSGFASVNYEPVGWQEADLVKLTVLLNHEEAPPLATICLRSQARTRALALAKRLKEAIPRQQFEIPIQVAIGGEIIAREDIKSYRKDVEAKLHGGDMSRNRKLLEKQKKGKARMKMIGQVALPQEAFLAAVRSEA
ncbi:MAG: translation elongation factor 4 [Patescibacteria group bacterium]